jgi:hypothetical protein
MDFVYDYIESNNNDIDLDFRYDVELQWVRSLVKKDHPNMSNDDIDILAQYRYETGYYSEYEF